jgi:hypothetical protein
MSRFKKKIPYSGIDRGDRGLTVMDNEQWPPATDQDPLNSTNW